jgi:hypothetical protein
MGWRLALSIIVIGICLGCGGGNGLPQDLVRHLGGKGITLKVVRSHAPLSSRGGYVIGKHEVAAEVKIVSVFNLQPLTAGDPGWQQIAARWKIGTKSTSIFGATGRPAGLKLKNGSQFEYFYLVIMGDGTMWLFAEYAYG